MSNRTIPINVTKTYLPNKEKCKEYVINYKNGKEITLTFDEIAAFTDVI